MNKNRNMKNGIGV
jgi:hypothetical protein